jgi:hypothetical protein
MAGPPITVAEAERKDPNATSTKKDLLPRPGQPGGSWEGTDAQRKAREDGMAADRAKSLAAQTARLTGQAVREKQDSIDRFNNLVSKGTIKYNPPAIAYTSGAPVYRNEKHTSVKKGKDGGYVPGASADRSQFLYGGPEGRDVVLGRGSQIARTAMKGSLMPDLSFSKDWATVGTDISDTLSFNYVDRANVLNQDGKGGFEAYGFRFPFNPASLEFQLSSTTNVNLGYIMSSKYSAMPTGLSTDGGGSISLQIPLSRVEDMQAITMTTSRSVEYLGGGGMLGTAVRQHFTAADIARLYGNNTVTKEDLAGIATRGTMYDLEFLFRTCLGKAWTTMYRGRTADVGLLFGVPLVLTLNRLDGAGTGIYDGGMRYRVRLSGINFTHKSFSPTMIPLYTEVGLSFDRIPDVMGY